MAYDQQPPKKTGLFQLLRESIGTQFVIPVYQRNKLEQQIRNIQTEKEKLISIIWESEGN